MKQSGNTLFLPLFQNSVWDTKRVLEERLLVLTSHLVQIVLYKDRMEFLCHILFFIRPRFLMALLSLHQQNELMTSINCLHLHRDPYLGTQCLWGHYFIHLIYFSPLKSLHCTYLHYSILPTVSSHSQCLLRCCSLFLLPFYISKELSVIYKCKHYTISMSSPRSLTNIQSKISS